MIRRKPMIVDNRKKQAGFVIMKQKMNTEYEFLVNNIIVLIVAYM